MDRSKHSSLVSSPVTTKAEAPRVRRKLQKGGAKQRKLSKRAEPDASNEGTVDGKSHNANKPSLPLPPDLSDSKWAEFLRDRVDLRASESPAKSSEGATRPIRMPSELAHLKIRDEKDVSSVGIRQPSSSPPAQSLGMRRRAKTPVFSIGQLEAASMSRTASEPDESSSVELIAEQYRELLESRCSVYTDCYSEPSPSRQGDRTELRVRRQHSSDDLKGAARLAPKAATEPLTGSPTSDDGTLVSFEEETVYFKPVSFSPEPISPRRNHEQPFASPSSVPDNLSLQICVDLLARDLSSAIVDRPRRCSSDSSALQIYVMIEAYERLRDQILDSPLRSEGTQSIELMFDVWLRALYAIHDSLTGDARPGDANLGELGLAQEELD